MTNGKTVKGTLTTTDPCRFVDVCDYLDHTFNRLKEEIPGYSYQRFACDLGLSSASNLHKMVKGTRAIGAKTAEKLADGLGLKGNSRRHFNKLISLRLASTSTEEKERLYDDVVAAVGKREIADYTPEKDQLHSEWYHFVVLELLALPHIDQSVQNLARLIRPRLRPLQIQKSVELLMDLGLVRYNPVSTRLDPTGGGVKTSAETTALLIAKYHQKVLDVSKEAILEVDETERDLSASTFRASREQVALFKKAIYQLHMQFLEKEPAPEQTDIVFQFNCQLIPVAADVSSESDDQNLPESA